MPFVGDKSNIRDSRTLTRICHKSQNNATQNMEQKWGNENGERKGEQV